MYGFANCSCGSSIESPTDFPPASYAPRFAASIIPGPPPEQITNRLGLGPSDSDHVVILSAGERATPRVAVRAAKSSLAMSRYYEEARELAHSFATFFS